MIIIIALPLLALLRRSFNYIHGRTYAHAVVQTFIDIG